MISVRDKWKNALEKENILDKPFYSKEELSQISLRHGLQWPFFIINATNRLVAANNLRNIFHNPFAMKGVIMTSSIEIPTVMNLTRGMDKTVSTDNAFVPTKDKNYVEWGDYTDVYQIIKSGIFYPVFITGLSGNGKTLMVEQACHAADRELFRVNITIETDEDDLIGGFRLENSQTIWQDGPVIQAMKRGAVLLLDEVDLASNRILVLQPILEGKGILLKKTGERVLPKKGFQIVATANTKGQGSETGHFIGTQELNEAFLERFAVTFEQAYPPDDIEKKILMKNMEENNVVDAEFANCLIRWAKQTRTTFTAGATSSLVTTRRLVHIVNAYAIWKSREKAIRRSIARFDKMTADSFFDAYTKIDVNYKTVWIDPDSPEAIAQRKKKEMEEAEARRMQKEKQNFYKAQLGDVQY